MQSILRSRAMGPMLSRRAFTTSSFRSSAAPNEPKRSELMKNWFAVEAIPIYAIIAVVLSGGTWYLWHLATRPSVVWTKSNPTPWNTVKPDEQTKLVTINQKFERTWSRDKM